MNKWLAIRGSAIAVKGTDLYSDQWLKFHFNIKKGGVLNHLTINPKD